MNGQNLETHKWKHRILIVRTSKPDLNTNKKQLEEFRDSENELMDRKIVRYKIVGNQYEFINYSNKASNHSGKISKNLIEKILNIKEKFEVLLIGLDGGIKLRKTKVLTKDNLFKTIDSMPMRKAELESRD